MENRYSPNNYKSYRSEVTTFLHWCFDVAEMSVLDVKRSHLSQFIDWCSNPPGHLVAHHNSPHLFSINNWPSVSRILAGARLQYNVRIPVRWYTVFHLLH